LIGNWLDFLLDMMRKEVDLKDVAELQRQLSKKLILRWEEKEVRFIGGADFSYDARRKAIAAAVVIFRVPELRLVEEVQAVQEVTFPYIPGYLAFREAPAFFAAFRKIKTRPQVTLVDGNGIAHPRRMGLASYIGVLLDIATIGCAKSPYFRSSSPGSKRGEFTDVLNDKREKVGVCLRTRDGIKPVFVSPGNQIDFSMAIRIVLDCSRYRIPEPLRHAHSSASHIFER
jgi:deoxyribonuclease V